MRFFWILGLLGACLPQAGHEQGSGGSTAAETSTGAATTAATTSATTTTAETSAATTASSTTTNDPTTGTSGSSFIAETDLGGGSIVECNVYAQDCPPGQKCAWTGSPEAQWWDTPACVPLVRDPVPDGAPCAYHLDPPFDGIDECG